MHFYVMKFKKSVTWRLCYYTLLKCLKNRTFDNMEIGSIIIQVEYREFISWDIYE